MKWDGNEAGQVSFVVLADFEVSLLADMAVAVRLEFFRSTEQAARGERESLQVSMSTHQTLQLGELVQKMAQRALARPAGPSQ